MDMLYRLQGKARYWPKIAIFFIVHNNPLAKQSEQDSKDIDATNSCPRKVQIKTIL